ncbi:MAG: VOC family protein [Actinobacteria bacterium]|nr:VOC family protein [Actinomycetota bacterium]
MPMRLNAIGILCSDLEASLGFYRAVGVPFSDFDPDEGHYSAELGDGIRLMLDGHEIARSFMEDFTPPQGNDLMTLAVEFGTPGEVDAAYAAITAAGHASVREPFDAFWGQRYATVADPDGNQVDLYAANLQA